MKNILGLFLLLVGQSLLAQSNWQVLVDEFDDAVILELVTNTLRSSNSFNSDYNYAKLNMVCDPNIGYPVSAILFHRLSEVFNNLEGFGFRDREEVELTYRIGINEAVTSNWPYLFSRGLTGSLRPRSPNSWHTFVYNPNFMDDGIFAEDDFSLNSSIFLEALVKDNTRFIIRMYRPERFGGFREITATWNIEGIAEVIHECLAVFD